ncbi:hypothetical protein FDP41_006140 [Naegleria fowleri]|uniref:Uncharacterized protein n=1 Tax=Naegleria fowleri TaxID=5763 RepID=A0A6A5BIN1_NAEFO|nr:uncharacterized protein FDP41_006140 [Naegleria fowleri]KAF0974666.1 hypothetical protein FDP41_006140 [Naegleria fowleri]
MMKTTTSHASVHDLAKHLKFHHYSSPPSIAESSSRFGASSQNVNLSGITEVLSREQEEQLDTPSSHRMMNTTSIRERSHRHHEYPSSEHHTYYSTSSALESTRLSGRTLNYAIPSLVNHHHHQHQQEPVVYHPSHQENYGFTPHSSSSSLLFMVKDRTKRAVITQKSATNTTSSAVAIKRSTSIITSSSSNSSSSLTPHTNHPPSKIVKKSSSKKKVIKRKYQYKHLLAADANKNNHKSGHKSSNITPTTQYVYDFGLWDQSSEAFPSTNTTTNSSIATNTTTPSSATSPIHHESADSSFQLHLNNSKQHRVQRRAVSSISKHEMLQVLHLTQQKASQILGCSLSTVKRRFYELKDEIGLNKWPQDFLELMQLSKEVFQKIYPMSLHFILNHDDDEKSGAVASVRLLASEEEEGSSSSSTHEQQQRSQLSSSSLSPPSLFNHSTMNPLIETGANTEEHHTSSFSNSTLV